MKLIGETRFSHINVDIYVHVYTCVYVDVRRYTDANDNTHNEKEHPLEESQAAL